MLSLLRDCYVVLTTENKEKGKVSQQIVLVTVEIISSMLTLKIITTDQNGQDEVYLFTGDIITHKEYFSQDHYLAKQKVEENNTIWYIGSLVESDSKQRFTASDISIYDEDRVCKNIIFVTAKAACYIMENGKTIDTFYLYFE